MKLRGDLIEGCARGRGEEGRQAGRQETVERKQRRCVWGGGGFRMVGKGREEGKC